MSDNVNTFESPSSQFTFKKFQELKDELLALYQSNPKLIPIKVNSYELVLHDTFNLIILEHLQSLTQPTQAEQEMLTNAQTTNIEIQTMIDSCSGIVLELMESLDVNSEIPLSEQVQSMCEAIVVNSEDSKRKHQAIVIREKLRGNGFTIDKGFFLFKLVANTKNLGLVSFVLMWMLLEEETLKLKAKNILELTTRSLDKLRMTYPFIMSLNDIILARKFYNADTGEPEEAEGFVHVEDGQQRIPVCKVPEYSDPQYDLKRAEELTQLIVHESLHLAIDNQANKPVVEMLTQYTTMHLLYQQKEDGIEAFRNFVLKSTGYTMLALLADCLATTGVMKVTDIVSYGLRQEGNGFVKFTDNSLAEISDYTQLIDEMSDRLIIGPYEEDKLKAKSKITLQDLLDCIEEYSKSIGKGMAEAPGLLIGGYAKTYFESTGEAITMTELVNNREKRTRFLRFIIDSKV